VGDRLVPWPQVAVPLDEPDRAHGATSGDEEAEDPLPGPQPDQKGRPTTVAPAKLQKGQTVVLDCPASIAPTKHCRRCKRSPDCVLTLSQIEKLEDVAETLEELWLSYNAISSLDGLGSLVNLTTLFMSNNLIKSWVEIDKLVSDSPEGVWRLGTGWLGPKIEGSCDHSDCLGWIGPVPVPVILC
jgi:hypothetical protein